MSKLTLVKLCGPNFKPSVEDLERWRDKFADYENNKEEINQAINAGEIVQDEIDLPKESDGHYITFVKVGDESRQPSVEDLENWRQIFEDASKDPDFKIFTHETVEIKIQKLSDMEVVGVE